MKRLAVLSVLLLVYLWGGRSLFAQTADVSGTVTDQSGALVPKAKVRLVNQATMVERNLTTNADGIFSAPFITPGVYQMFVEAPGFSTEVIRDLKIEVGGKINLPVRLHLGQRTSTVLVDGGGLTLNTTDGSVSTVIERDFVENIPLNGRSFQDLISMTPGITTQSPQASSTAAYNGDFSVNGQRTESNYYLVDGVSANTSAGTGGGQPQAATSGSIAASTALGTTQSLISVDALQEFRVESSTYSAEYGRTPGAQFSFATKSGTNDLHGSAFDYLRNNYFDANDWFNDHYSKPIPALRQNDFGGTLGGPILIPDIYDGRNKSFFFVSYEGLRLTQPQAASILYVPDAYMRQQATALRTVVNAFPVSNGKDYGSMSSPSLAQFIQAYSLPSHINATSVRVDQAFSPKLSAFIRVGHTPSATDSRVLSALSTNSINADSYTLGVTDQLNSRLVEELHLGYTRAQSSARSILDNFGGAQPINLSSAMGLSGDAASAATFYLNFYGIGQSVLQTSNPSNFSRQWNIVDTLSISSGRHQVKLGIDFRRINSGLIVESPFAEGLYFTGQSVIKNDATLLFVEKSVSAEPIFSNFSLFAQDEWKASSSLSVSAGLRWEVNPPPTEAHGNLPYTLIGNISDPNSLILAPHGTSLWDTSWLNFAPRLGAAWRVRGMSAWNTVLRSGAGVYFDTDNQIAVDGFGGLGFFAYREYAASPLPVTQNQLDFSTAVSAPYTGSYVYAFPRHFQLPYTLEWNTSLEQALGEHQSLTLSYVGSNGRRLVQVQQLDLASLNPNFGNVDYALSTTSNYQSLQLKFQRSVGRGLHALASYSWSHAIDFGSNSASLGAVRGNADFDVRNNLVGGISWDIPAMNNSTLSREIFGNWGLDGRVEARTGFPVTLQGNLLTDPATGNQYYGNLNLVPNQPLYLHGAQYPGGRALNRAAFFTPTGNALGTAPRNFARGFDAVQVNLAARREFHLYERLRLQFRAEAFNILNHPNFGYIDPILNDATFGQATKMLNQSLGTVAAEYQQGGPRSMQFALRMVF